MKSSADRFKAASRKYGLDLIKGLDTHIVRSRENDKWSCFINKEGMVILNFYYYEELDEEEVELDENIPKDLQKFYNYLVLLG